MGRSPLLFDPSLYYLEHLDGRLRRNVVRHCAERSGLDESSQLLINQLIRPPAPVREARAE